MKRQIIFPLLLIFAFSACTEIGTVEPVTSSQPVITDSSNEANLQPTVPIQTVISEPIVIEPVDNETKEFEAGEQMPVFMEVTQTTILGENFGQGPSLGVGPNIYFYNPDSGVLALNQSIFVEENTELFIGVENILQTPNQEYTKKEIDQYPSIQPVLIQIAAFDTETGVITMIYEGEKFDLPVDESRTFKQVGETNTPSVIIVISNHGRLVKIHNISSDGSWR